MNDYLRLLLALALIALAPIVNGQTIRPQVSKDYPLEVGIFLDGGTFLIVDRATKDSAERHYCIDRGIASETNGEFYSGAIHPSFEGAVRINPDEAKRILNTLKAKLEKVYGREKLAEIRKNPVDPDDGSMSDEEAMRVWEDPAFHNQEAAIKFLDAMERYITQQNAKSNDADQPATAPESKPNDKEKPKSKAEGRFK